MTAVQETAAEKAKKKKKSRVVSNLVLKSRNEALNLFFFFLNVKTIFVK